MRAFRDSGPLARIGAMDFGWDHPFAAVELAWDADQHIIYVIKAHRLREATPVVHAGALRAGGPLPWAWPRDGRRETLPSGLPSRPERRNHGRMSDPIPGRDPNEAYEVVRSIRSERLATRMAGGHACATASSSGSRPRAIRSARRY